MKLSLPLGPAGSHQLLDDFEHGHNVPFRWGTELCHQKDSCREQPLGGIEEVLVLPEVCPVHSRGDDGLGDDFGIPLRLGLEQKGFRVGLVSVYVLVH